MTIKLEIIDHEGEAALIFPDAILKKLNVSEGDTLTVTEVSDGLILRKEKSALT